MYSVGLLAAVDEQNPAGQQKRERNESRAVGGCVRGGVQVRASKGFHTIGYGLQGDAHRLLRTFPSESPTDFHSTKA